jgi:hypothetical protein
VVLSVLVVTMITGRVSVGGALLALALLATAEVFADNTSMTLTPMLVHRDDLATANSRLLTGFITLNQLVGPPIGAALFAAGRVWPFVTEAVLVSAGVILVSRVVLPPHGRGSTDAAGTVWRDMAEGFRWTVHHAAVRTLSLSILIFNITFGAAWSVLVLYATQRLGLGAVGFGLLSTVSAVGGLLGTGLYGWITRRVSLGNVMRAGLVIETLTHGHHRGPPCPGRRCPARACPTCHCGPSPYVHLASSNGGASPVGDDSAAEPSHPHQSHESHEPITIHQCARTKRGGPGATGPAVTNTGP